MSDMIISNASNNTLEQNLSLEWLETNGLGGYSSSTILNCNTRKYHGLLVSQLYDPPGKFVLLSSMEDTLSFKNNTCVLSSHQYRNTTEMSGHLFLDSFSIDTHPVFHYIFDNIRITKEILMLKEENTVLIKYQFNAAQSTFKQARIYIRPFLSYRDFHALSRENSAIHTDVVSCENGIQLSPYDGMPAMYFQTNGSFDFSHEPLWYNDLIYERERERGFSFQEDLFTPGKMTVNLSKNQSVIFSFSLLEQKNNLSFLWEKERNTRKRGLEKTASVIVSPPVIAGASVSGETMTKAKKNKHVLLTSLQDRLKDTAKQFIIKKETLGDTSIIAGYHWFLEWGRDAMISLPGLTLYSGLEKQCLAVLQYFAAHSNQGIIPNYITSNPEGNTYNTVDASLWFIWAVQQYYLKTNDLKSIERVLWSTLKNIINYYQSGTLYHIKQNKNGLIYVGDPSLNLTWMDAKVDGLPVNPRNGAPVEVNALWYNALCFVNEIAQALHDPIYQKLTPLIEHVKIEFRTAFWNDELGCLYDFISDKEHNGSIRPNQIFAVSLPFSPLTQAMSEQVVQVVTTKLLTPFGLRTLARDEDNYKGRYEGGPIERDLAYHNGTVWPWLIGHYGAALLNVSSDSSSAYNVLKPCILALEEHVYRQAGLGSISEVFDGDPPHRPNGCISQAWSVAELIRLIHLLDV